MLQHNKARYQPFWSDPLNPIFCLSLIFLAGTLRSLPVQVRLLLVLAAAISYQANVDVHREISGSEQNLDKGLSL